MSRPRKRILVWSEMETGIATTLFVLNTQRHFHAHAVHSAAEFAAQIESFRPDAALLFYDGAVSEAPLRQCGALADGARLNLVVVARVKRTIEPRWGIALQFAQSGMADVIHALRIQCSRKRGPKPAHSANQGAAVQAGLHAAERSERMMA